MNQYEVIYSKNNGNEICSQIFKTKTLLDFIIVLDKFKSKEMIYNDTILEIKEKKS
tara:strand:- start:34 stop:201 length:168 start_codon:yes stop_codon:yes gene_type:complete